MIKLKYYSKSADKKDISFLPAERYLKFNEPLVAQAVRVERNREILKTAKTKTRTEVSGGGRKPWRQKGTGNARAGSIRSPLFRGGGITFGPTGEKKLLNLPHKMKKLAFYQILVKKALLGDILVLETNKIETNKTKDAERLRLKICPDRDCYLVYTKEEKNYCRPWNNLALIECKPLNNLKLGDIISGKMIILTDKAYQSIKDEIKNG